jgi:hypothetical protein
LKKNIGVQICNLKAVQRISKGTVSSEKKKRRAKYKSYNGEWKERSSLGRD